jgi:hypothetical protein
MREHPFDSFAKRLAAAENGVSRRRFLASSAAVALATSVPLRFPGVASAEGVTSCNCQGYADQVYLDCWDDIVDTGGPYNDDNGAVAAIQFGVTNRFAESACQPSADKAQSDCTQVPCPKDQSCYTPPAGAPMCHDNCSPRCTGTNLCCEGECTDARSDVNNCGTCGHSCTPPSTCHDGRCVLLCGKQVCPPGTSCCAENCIPTSEVMCCNNFLGPDVCPLYSNQEGFPGKGCTNVLCDASNCGACGNQCGSSADGGGVCQCGSCVYGPYIAWCGPCCDGKPCRS